jgi:hypothetical protein
MVILDLICVSHNSSGEYKSQPKAGLYRYLWAKVKKFATREYYRQFLSHCQKLAQLLYTRWTLIEH